MQIRQGQPEARRPGPPPREADDRQVTAVITAGWAIALVVLLCIRGSLPADARWWIWTCVSGIVMGLFGLWYVPFLKRRRARIAASRAQSPAGSSADSVSSATSVTSADGPAGSTADGSAGAANSGPASGYVSRDSGSNTVSSTETPGRSTRS
jgi:hypothetical protein